MPLGLFDGIPYDQYQLQLQPEDMLYLYTDGVTEAMDEQHEQFGEARLRQTLAAMEPGFDAAGMLNSVQAAVKGHAGAAEQSDDITMLGFVYHGPAEDKGGRQDD